MIIEDLYNAWKEQKSQTVVGENFTGKVINQVYQYEQTKPKPLFDMQRLTEFISTHSLAKAVLIASAAVAGFVRVAFMIHILLFGN